MIGKGNPRAVLKSWTACRIESCISDPSESHPHLQANSFRVKFLRFAVNLFHLFHGPHGAQTEHAKQDRQEGFHVD